METLDSHPDIRYDYRMLVADYVLNEFYRPFTRICGGLGAFSRVQCHGSPTDLIAAYGSVDVPESEAILHEEGQDLFRCCGLHAHRGLLHGR